MFDCSSFRNATLEFSKSAQKAFSENLDAQNRSKIETTPAHRFRNADSESGASLQEENGASALNQG